MQRTHRYCHFESLLFIATNVETNKNKNLVMHDMNCKNVSKGQKHLKYNEHKNKEQ